MKKTKLKWTKKLPTVDGFYYWKPIGAKPDGRPNSMLIVDSGYVGGCFMSARSVFDPVWLGQWYGPIPSKEPT